MPTTAAPPDDDLEELTATVDEAPIQVEQAVDQFAAAPPSSIRPVAEDQITATPTAVPGCLPVIDYQRRRPIALSVTCSEHDFRLSVCLSDCNVGGLWDHIVQ